MLLEPEDDGIFWLVDAVYPLLRLPVPTDVPDDELGCPWELVLLTIGDDCVPWLDADVIRFVGPEDALDIDVLCT